VEAARSKLCSSRTTAGAGDCVSCVTVICSAACTDWVGQALDPHSLDKRRNFLSKLDVFALASIVSLGGGEGGRPLQAMLQPHHCGGRWPCVRCDRHLFRRLYSLGWSSRLTWH